MALDILIIDPHGGKTFADSINATLNTGPRHRIDTPESHQEALQKLRERGGNYDAIILEYDQRELERTEMLAAISEHAPKARRVGFSIHWTEQNSAAAGLAMYNKNSGPIIAYLEKLAREKI